MSSGSRSADRLPPQFRKWNIDERREAVTKVLCSAGVSADQISLGIGENTVLANLADLMVESAVGYCAMPLAICLGFPVAGRELDIPLVTEEPSVVAALSYASRIAARAGGFETVPGEPVTTGQIFIEGAGKDAEQSISGAESSLREIIKPILASMTRRGGGYRGMDVRRLPETDLLRVQIHIDVRNAMGANLVNTVSEALRPALEEATGGRCLMAILSNASVQRLTSADVVIPERLLGRSGQTGAEVARRIVLATGLAGEDPTRAVTHNKGIMNGITALMLATGNDSRAVEAAVHFHASRSGIYLPLTSYELVDHKLHGHIELPVPVGTVGGAAGVHPTSRISFALLGHPGSAELAGLAAAVGLAQNLAALSALVTEGIQTGHMALHRRRQDWVPSPGDSEGEK